jgi:hypothetical protein
MQKRCSSAALENGNAKSPFAQDGHPAAVGQRGSVLSFSRLFTSTSREKFSEKRFPFVNPSGARDPSQGV